MNLGVRMGFVFLYFPITLLIQPKVSKAEKSAPGSQRVSGASLSMFTLPTRLTIPEPSISSIKSSVAFLCFVAKIQAWDVALFFICSAKMVYAFWAYCSSS